MIPPGSVIGILGGGQLGRMTAMAARSLGYAVHALDPDSQCAARAVVDECFAARFDDVDAADRFGAGCDVITLEIEKIALPVLEAAGRHAPVRPSAQVLGLVQDRAVQKAWLQRNGFPVGPWREVVGSAEAVEAVRALGGASFVKSCTGGYDGRAQVEVGAPEAAAVAFHDLGGGRCVVEQRLALEAELSVMVARSPSGESRVFPPALNHHEQRILAWSVLPAPIPPRLAAEAEAIARGIADAIGIEGILAVELFVLSDGRVLVNELAPRPHNTFHATERACHTSQFEQLVRAICDLPLGSVDVVRPTAIANLLGDLWLQSEPPDFAGALSVPGARLHLYGKTHARPGRKMGHLSAVGDDPEQAIAQVQEATRRLARQAPD